MIVVLQWDGVSGRKAWDHRMLPYCLPPQLSCELSIRRTNSISKYNALWNRDKEYLVTNISFWRLEVQALLPLRFLCSIPMWLEDNNKAVMQQTRKTLPIVRFINSPLVFFLRIFQATRCNRYLIQLWSTLAGAVYYGSNSNWSSYVFLWIKIDSKYKLEGKR